MTAPVASAMTAERGIADAIRTLGLSFPDDAHGKLAAYLSLLAKWNRTYNLTALREPEQMVTHHLADALAVLPYLPSRDDIRLLDVGSGGGVPGIPLAIARPTWDVVLVDSNQKKVAFLVQAIIELKLRNATAIAARVEDLQIHTHFDAVISRAFADLATFAQTSMQHVVRNGKLYAMKGAMPNDEIAGLPASIEVSAAPRLTVPGVDAERHLIVMQRREGSDE
jgi:16S rRNA (guanine527-N7)-methyltransferase